MTYPEVVALLPSTLKTKKIEKTVEKDPTSSLCKIVKTASLICSPVTIAKVLKEAKLTLHVKRPKLWLNISKKKIFLPDYLKRLEVREA